MTQRLLEMRSDNCSASVISKQLSFEFNMTVTRNAVIGKMQRVESPKPRQYRKTVSFWTPERETRLRKMIEEGRTYNDIGYSFGKDRNTIANKCASLGIKSLYKNFDSKRVNKMNRIDRKAAAWEKTAKEKSEWRKKVAEANKRKQNGIVLPPVVKYEIDKFGHIGNPNARRVSLMDLQHNWCHFTSGDPKTSNFFYCGADVPEGSAKPYCEYCYKIMYVPSRYHASSSTKVYR